MAIPFREKRGSPFLGSCLWDQDKLSQLFTTFFWKCQEKDISLQRKQTTILRNIIRDSYSGEIVFPASIEKYGTTYSVTSIDENEFTCVCIPLQRHILFVSFPQNRDNGNLFINFCNLREKRSFSFSLTL